MVLSVKQNIKVYICMKVTQLYPTLCNPMDYTVRGSLQARILEWVAFSFSNKSVYSVLLCPKKMRKNISGVQNNSEKYIKGSVCFLGERWKN